MPQERPSHKRRAQPKETPSSSPLFTLDRPIPADRIPLIEAASDTARNLREPMSTHLPPLLFSQEVPVDRFWRGDFGSQQTARTAYEKAYQGRKLSETGEQLRVAVSGRTVFDLGSGNPGRSLIAPVLHLFGAKNYVGVERHTLSGDQPLDRSQNQYVKMDMLEFLSRLEIPDTAPRPAFLMSGLAPYIAGTYDEELNAAYIRACLEELQRITKTDDPMVLFRTFGIDPTQHGFQKRYESNRVPQPADLTIYKRMATDES